MTRGQCVGDHPRPSAAASSAITLVTHEFFPARGGVGVYVHELASAAARQGYDVCVVAPWHHRWRELDTAFVLEPSSFAESAGGWRYVLGSARYLFLQRRTLGRTTLHICQQGPLRALMVLHALGLIRPQRLIVTLHGSELLQISGSRMGGRWMLRKLLERADRVAVLSGWVRDELVRRYPTVAARTTVAPGAPRSDGKLPRASRRDTRSRVTVLTVGRIHPRKGQHNMVNAIRRIDADLGRHIRYLMVGPVVSRDYANLLRDLAASGGLEVELVGEVEDKELAQHYADADIFAMTSEHQPRSVEGFGLAIMEASGNGLPILAHRTGGIGDTVQDGVTGLLVEPGDLDGLASGLLRLVDEPELRRRLGANGEAWAKRFSWERCAALVYGSSHSQLATRHE